jgi:hypothetical protein
VNDQIKQLQNEIRISKKLPDTNPKPPEAARRFEDSAGSAQASAAGSAGGSHWSSDTPDGRGERRVFAGIGRGPNTNEGIFTAWLR